jgi:hypothetical protein
MIRLSLPIGAAVMALLVLARAALAAAAAVVPPVPPCAGPPLPAFPALGAPPTAIVWHQDAASDAWHPPDCLGKFADEPAVVVTVAARFRAAEASAILSRFGAVSQLTRIRYWSVSDREWMNLVTRASALSRPDPKAIRSDFTAAEVASGQPLYYAQRDNRSSAPVIYRMVGQSPNADRLVIETENVTAVKFFLLPIFPVGGLRVTYFLERTGADSWTFYSFTAVDKRSSSMALANDRSFINRAVAVYRHIAGISTEQEPPPAP